MNIHDLIFMILPAILPVILAYFNNPVWPPVVKAVIPFVVCMVLATVEILVSTPDVTAMGWLAVMTKAYGTCMAAYAAFWKSPLVGWLAGFKREGNIADEVENHHGTGS